MVPGSYYDTETSVLLFSLLPFSLKTFCTKYQIKTKARSPLPEVEGVVAVRRRCWFEPTSWKPIDVCTHIYIQGKKKGGFRWLSEKESACHGGDAGICPGNPHIAEQLSPVPQLLKSERPRSPCFATREVTAVSLGTATRERLPLPAPEESLHGNEDSRSAKKRKKKKKYISYLAVVFNASTNFETVSGGFFFFFNISNINLF